MKPLFIPLKTEFFEAFENGTKDTEYRLYGSRWNERTCLIGREVVLSHGYGKGRRLRGTVVGFEVSTAPTTTEAWLKCYGGNAEGTLAACIRVALMGPNLELSASQQHKEKP